MSLGKDLTGLFATVWVSVVLIIMGIIYYMLTVWIIKTGAGWAGYPNVEGSTVVLTAGIVTAASMLGSALYK